MFRNRPGQSSRPRLIVLVLVVASSLLVFANQATSQTGGVVVSSPYGDVALSNTHRDNIASLKAAGILDGTECGPDQFCPNEALSRRTFAVWMVRVLDGDQAPGFVDPAVGGSSRFADVDADEPEALFIDRMAELRVTNGCATNPWRYCPDKSVTRAQMASFLARAFGLPGAGDAGFTDVNSDSGHYDNINMLAASKITVGCSSQPKRYCPNKATTRAQMASFLARAIEWRDTYNLVDPESEEPEPVVVIEPIDITGSDNSVQLEVDYDESAHQAKVSWRPTSSNSNQTSHYIVQWRPYWDGFTDNLQQRVEVSELQNGRYRVSIDSTQNLYGVRVVVVRSTGTQLATSDVKVPSNSNRLRDLIKERIIDPHQDEWPWLRETWRHMSGPEFGFGVRNLDGRSARVHRGSQSADRNSFDRKTVKSLTVRPVVLEYFDGWKPTIIHELGHVYTLTNDIGNPLSQGAGLLYFHLIYVNHRADAKNPGLCLGSELYADMAELTFFDEEFTPGTRGPGYWSSCGLQLSSQEYWTIKDEAPAVALSVFRHQEAPNWFYNTYQRPGSGINLDKLWDDINSGGPSRTRSVIAGHLRYEFGGYCSEEQVRKFLDGRIDQLDTPWRDAGC